MGKRQIRAESKKQSKTQRDLSDSAAKLLTHPCLKSYALETFHVHSHACLSIFNYYYYYSVELVIYPFFV